MDLDELFDPEQTNFDLEDLKNNEIIARALGEGVELPLYLEQINEELAVLEQESVKDYLGESGNVKQLNREISANEKQLDELKDILEEFQSDLVQISQQIQHIQTKSLTMNVRVKNREAVEVPLSKFLEKTMLDQEMIDGISSSQIDDAFMGHLDELGKKIRFIESKEALSELGLDISPTETAAARELIPELQKLKACAVEKAERFLMAKISELKKPNTNIQIIQASVLLKYSALSRFLRDNSPDTFTEVVTVYGSTMSKVLAQMCKSYRSDLGKLKVKKIKRSATVVCKNIFTGKIDSADALSLGNRLDLLNKLQDDAIIAHAQPKGARPLFIEEIFKSEQQILMDLATAEYEFLVEFFDHPRFNIFNFVFKQTLDIRMQYLQDLVAESHDSLGILMMVLVTIGQRKILQQRCIPCLDTHLDSVNMLLWPRFKILLDSNLKSVQNALNSKIPNVDLRLHLVSRRCGDYLAAVWTLHSRLSADGMSDQMLPIHLNAMRFTLEELWTHMSKTMNSSSQLTFKINQVHHLVQCMKGVSTDEHKYFSDLEAKWMNEYVQAVLQPALKCILPLLDAETTERDALNFVRDFESLTPSFCARLQDIVLKGFGDLNAGTDILKRVFTALIQEVSKAQEALSSRRITEAARQLSGLQSLIMHDIRAISAKLR
eukprot:TRINITY_DN426_c0_g1_i2.p1 TRINITY_DN426_c0_g1~~TRINITY_DN426_c0_g1_i2.p1  ORF type:complete len:664 (+),score=181.31 TRINITY_DN426_c0_g1_i2:127-2118(+)